METEATTTTTTTTAATTAAAAAANATTAITGDTYALPMSACVVSPNGKANERPVLPRAKNVHDEHTGARTQVPSKASRKSKVAAKRNPLLPKKFWRTVSCRSSKAKQLAP